MSAERLRGVLVAAAGEWLEEVNPVCERAVEAARDQLGAEVRA